MAKDSLDIKPEWKLASEGPAGIELMFEACRSARKSIDCEQFIFGNDATGKRFLDLFFEKLREGVKIRLLCDMVGSFGLYASEWPEKLREAGAEVLFFRVISPWRIGNFTGWYLRTHRKVLIIDGRLAVIGGLAISDEALRWRDATLSITGRTVDQLSDSFERMRDSAEEEMFFRFKRFKEYSGGFRVSTNAPHYRQKYIYKNIVGSIRNAKESIHLATPYFTPNHRFVQALRKAARRGVAVKLILPDETDSKWLSRAARSYFGRLLKAGVRIFLYQKSFMHAKTATTDGSWASVGSFNLDSQSFFWNYETNVESIDRTFVGEVDRQFEEDLRNSKEVRYRDWLARPFYQKIMEWITFPFHRFM